MLAGFSLASSRFRISFFYFFFIFNLWWLWPCVDTSISHEPWCMVRKSIEWTLRWESCLQVRRCALKSTIVVVGVAHPTLSQHVSTGHVPPNPILSILGIQSSCIGGSIAHLMGLFFFCKRTHSRLIMNHGGMYDRVSTRIYRELILRPPR